MLFEADDRRVLNVLCNVSAFYFDVTIQLDLEENAGYLRDGEPFIERLADTVRSSLDAFRTRMLPDFLADPQVRAAAEAWRASHE